MLAGLPADVVALSLAPDVNKLVDGGPRGQRAGTRTSSRASSPTRSWCSWCARATRRTSRPGTTCIKPGVEVIDAQPVHLGRRALEHHGRLRRPARAGQVARTRRPSTSSSSSSTWSCRTRAPARRCRRSPAGKGDVLHLLRERGDHRPAEGPGRRLRHPRPDDPDPEPDRGRHQVARTRRRPRRSSTYLRTPRGPEDLRVQGLPLDAARTLVDKTQVPDAARALHDRQARRLEHRERRRSSIRRRASWRTSSGTTVSPPA